jgi:hypothetical protein
MSARQLRDFLMNERRLEAVLLGPGKPGLLRVSLGRGDKKFVADVPFDILPPPLRLPNSQFVAVVDGRELVRVEPDGRTWLTIQDQVRSVLNADWDPIGVADINDGEYDRYIGHIYSLVASNASERTIAEHMLLIERERMQLQGTPMDQLLKVAAKLRSLPLPSPDRANPQP